MSWSDLAQSNGLVSTQVRGGGLKICHPFIFSLSRGSHLRKGENHAICGLSMLLAACDLGSQSI